MPENKDGEYTTDQNRSGGEQTRESTQRSNHEAREGEGYGKSTGQSQGQATGTQRQQEGDDGERETKTSDEQRQREIARDSQHTDPPAQEWSPGSHQPNS